MGVPHGKGSSQGDRTDATINERTQLSEALLALKIKGDRRRQKEIKDISFVA